MPDLTPPGATEEPIRVPDHDLDDLAATVAKLVTDGQRVDETLTRLVDEAESRPDPSVSGATGSREEPSSIFILALDGRAYTEELAALATWVHHLFLPVYGREITAGRPWCARWAEHPEAVARLHALWLAWQQLTDAEAGLTGPAVWHRDHLDPTLQHLRSPDGPFGACTTSPARPHHRLLPFPEAAGA
ncbi:DUF4913 domain-containing protein [Streptomyces sp. ST2-7A]|uniref:DUF4913 domain-containing protein n=1 Tax=Streptomyces sp. ST2-7A TaxID=2907214 RepID=UPI001F2657C6|nr:DUF4913 domain-containing protein [Streptomyces sp. ST2-7A]MCE7080158.1 DUF4913 domain-containing protein [Streptomyces sp. ST2-7A]